jgi:Uri superfamily endonuclease
MRSPQPPLPQVGGTYGLGLLLDSGIECAVGTLGQGAFPAGLYLYVGSAWGPGGLGARLGRHLRGDGATHWHIDYLRPWARPVALWTAPGEHLECAWAQALADHPGARIAMPRFGASDCRCASHLFGIDEPALSSLALPGSPDRLLWDVEGFWF